MSKKGRPRLPRYVLSTSLVGQKMFLSGINTLKAHGAVVTQHTPHIGMAVQFTKYKADNLCFDLSDNMRQYEVEPLHLS